MMKPWSITTTVRNPERIRDFLIVLQKLEGCEWNSENQKKYQILLIQNRLYGYGNPQFYNRLSQDTIKLIDDSSKAISFQRAEDIFNAHGYEDPAIRGRQSINPLKKFGFVAIEDKKVKITALGQLFIGDDFDFEEIFFRMFLKWQIPNPGSQDYSHDGRYDIKPFVGVLHLINAVNRKEDARGGKTKGISKKEFSLFVPTLVHYQSIDDYAERIIALRDKISGKATKEQETIFNRYQQQFAREFLGTRDGKAIKRLLSNLKDYGDNAVRYFRLTRYILIRGGGFYVDLEPRRSVEVSALLDDDNAQSRPFDSKEAYTAYLADISEPKLPWETRKKYAQIISNLTKEIRAYESTLQKDNRVLESFSTMGDRELKAHVLELRAYRRELQNEESHRKSQTVESIEKYIEVLDNIFEFTERPILLEKFSALGLYALNDALQIQANHPVGDDNEPTFTAPANVPDIECFYKCFNAICEVTMLRSRDQWYNEGQPVMRHLREFEKKYDDKPAYCLFIAPMIHRDTLNTFWIAIKHEYEGQKQKIIPLSIKQFADVLEVLVKIKSAKQFLPHTEILRLFNDVVDSAKSFKSSQEWLKHIPSILAQWQARLTRDI